MHKNSGQKPIAYLKNVRAPRANITREEKKGLRELKEDNDRIVLTVDKGVAM